MEDVKTLIEKLTLEEKVSLLSGKTFWTTVPIERLGIPSVKMTDGPNGTREEVSGGSITNVMKDSVPSTCFPPAVTAASTWDKDLEAQIGKAIGEEAATQGVSTVLGPGTNIKRSPLCGRNFEYFSEDPYLAGEMATAFINGMQKSTKVGCSLKHFCANNQENSRMSIDAIIDERTMREIYLPAFEKAVKLAQPSQVMCSYNRLNGEYVSDSRHYLTDVLRGEWGFKGMVVSDWGAVNCRPMGVKAGLDLEMPGNNGMNDKTIINWVNEGKISEEELNTAVTKVLEYVDRSEKAKQPGYKCDYDAHHQLARKVAAEGSVLFKNDNILPFNKTDKIAVIGALAQTPRYQGGGSSQIHPKKLVTFIEALKLANVNYEYAAGYSLKGDGYNAKLLKEAVELAKNNDKVVVMIGLTPEYESEGFDRKHMDLPMGHNKLIDEIAKVNSNIAVVLVCGSPVTLPWTKRVGAILNAYVGGEACGEALCDVLFGDVNPCGKLAETFPKHLSDCMCSAYFPMGSKNVQYREGLYVGYRYFDTAGKSVRYPFGFGLSYTTFEFTNLKLSANKIADTDTLTVSFDVTNSGAVAGAEVAQVYVKDIASTAYRPDKELKGFEKVFLQPGETKTVSVTLDRRAFAFYNTAVSDWTVEAGEFQILVGNSSRDIKLDATVEVTAPAVEIVDNRNLCNVYYNISESDVIPVEQFAALYGKPVPENVPPKRGEFEINSTLQEVTITHLGKFLSRVLIFGVKIVTKGTANRDMAINSVITMPLRSFCGFTGGLISQMSVEGLVDMFNKKKGGFKKLCQGFKKSQRPNR